MLERPGQAWHKALHEHERHPRYEFLSGPRGSRARKAPVAGRPAALEEAAERRRGIDARAADLAARKEHNGRGGLEPVRYEDWEVKRSPAISDEIPKACHIRPFRLVLIRSARFAEDLTMTKPRLDYFAAAPATMKAMLDLENRVKASGLEPGLIHLVKTRASQINGRAFCIHMHTREARQDGETEERLYLSTPGANRRSTATGSGRRWPGPRP